MKICAIKKNMSLNFFFKRENNSRSEKKDKINVPKNILSFKTLFVKLSLTQSRLIVGGSFYNFGDFCTLISLNSDSPSL